MASVIRWVAAVVLAIALAAGASGAPARAAEVLIARRLDAALAGFSGTASVSLIDLRTGSTYERAADRIVPAASLYKLGVMVEAYRRAAEGTLSFDDPLTVTDEDLTDDGYYTAAGTVLTVRDAVEKMITLSDNSPAHALVRLLDAHEINYTMTDLGFPGTRINTALPEEERTAAFNTTTARDMGRLFLLLGEGELLAPAPSQQMLAVLRRQRINDRLPAGLPAGATIAHKTGDLPGVSHDAGLLTGPMGSRVVVMLTTDFASYDDVVSLAEQLGSTAFETPLDPFAARFDRVLDARTVSPRSFGRWETQVRNASAFTWGRGTFLVERLGSGRSAHEFARIPLPPIAPGAALPLFIAVPAPSAPGTYIVELEVVDAVLGGSGNTLPLVLVVRP